MAYIHSITHSDEGFRNNLKPAHSSGTQGLKRRCSSSQNECSSSTQSRKKPRLPSPPASGALEQDDIRGQISAIDYWAQHQAWPADFGEMDPSDSSQNSRKRKKSYSQSVRDGEMPRAHTPAAENELARSGIYMDEINSKSRMSEDSKTLCENLLSGTHEPLFTPFPLSRFFEVFRRAGKRNEARVVRDITPLLIPSAELLFLGGGHDELQFVAEEINAEWTKPGTMGSSKPKPDFAAGLSASAFTDDELSKMKNYTTSDRPTLFTDELYFPFLLGEAKSGNQGINRAERQNLHSSSIVVRSIIELYESLGPGKADSLMGKVLVFSISHDNERVKIHGHYAIRAESRFEFYRYQIRDYIFTTQDGPGWQLSYCFVRELYNSFYPDHRKRIQDALKEMKTPPTHSEIPSLDTDSQVEFQVPQASATQMLNDQIKLLQQTQERLERQLQQERQERQAREDKQERQHQEQIERLERKEKEERQEREKEKRQHQEQIERQERLHQQQIDILKQLLDR